MEPAFRSLLYDRPGLYDLVFPEPDQTRAEMCREAFKRYLSLPPASLVDIGCGNGRLLASLSASIPECWGVDLVDSNIAYARSRGRAGVFHVGDMRTVRLGRTFDVVTCLGNVLSYMLADADLEKAITTFATHAHPGSLLILDLLNARCYLDGDEFRERIEGRIETPEWSSRPIPWSCTASIGRRAECGARAPGRSPASPTSWMTPSIGCSIPRKRGGFSRQAGSRCSRCTTTASSGTRTLPAPSPPSPTAQGCAGASCTSSP